jgi:hypothetical protein
MIHRDIVHRIWSLQCLLLAQSGRWADRGPMTAFDPKRTYNYAVLSPFLVHLHSNLTLLVREGGAGIDPVKPL